MKILAKAAIVGLLSLGVVAPAALAQHGGQHSRQRASVAQSVAALLAQNPEGGAALTSGIYRLLSENPYLANDIVAAAGAGNQAQQMAVGAALGEASVLFQADARASAAILAANRQGGPALQDGFSSGRETSLAQLGGGGGGGSGGAPFVLIPTSSGGVGGGITSRQ
jgi:hypothetical protein